MSNGGYKGTTPARETSPEQYPGVWELTEQFQAQADGNWPFQETDCAPKSLRFDGRSAYLSRTLTASSNRRTWTMSMWVKRAKLGALQDLFSAGQEATNDGKYARFQFMADDTFRLRFWTEAGGLDANLQTTRVFRDCSAFYHFTIRHDSTETNQEDRLRIYVNGELITSYSSPDYLSSSVEGHWNYSAKTQMIGAHYDGGGSNTDSYFDGVIAEVHHIDGQSLPPEEFAFEDSQGIWQPKRFTGDYSSGPVYSQAATITGNPDSASYSYSNVFDGTPLSGATAQADNAQTPYVYRPNTAISGNTIRIRMAYYGNPNNDFFQVNGVSYGNAVKAAMSASTEPWYTLPVQTINTTQGIAIKADGTNSFNLAGIEVDGIILADASVGRNSFMLDFSDGVKDQSGLGNNWTANNIELPGPLVQDWESMLTGAHDTNHGWGTTYGSDNMFDGDLNTYTIGQANATGLTFTPTSPLGASATTIRIYGMDDNCPDSHLIINGVNYGGLVNSGTTWTVLKGTGAVGSGITSITSIYLRDNSTGNQHYRFAALEIDGVIVTQGGDPDLFVDSPVNGNEASTGAGGERRGNYATLNPLNSTSSTTLSDGNLAMTSGANWGSCMSTVAFTGGKFY